MKQKQDNKKIGGMRLFNIFSYFIVCNRDKRLEIGRNKWGEVYKEFSRIWELNIRVWDYFVFQDEVMINIFVVMYYY